MFFSNLAFSLFSKWQGGSLGILYWRKMVPSRISVKYEMLRKRQGVGLAHGGLKLGMLESVCFAIYLLRLKQSQPKGNTMYDICVRRWVFSIIHCMVGWKVFNFDNIISSKRASSLTPHSEMRDELFYFCLAMLQLTRSWISLYPSFACAYTGSVSKNLTLYKNAPQTKPTIGLQTFYNELLMSFKTVFCFFTVKILSIRFLLTHPILLIQ